MKLIQKGAQLYIPDGISCANALSRTTDLCIAAHQDDIEIMAYATFFASHTVDETGSISFGLDITELVENDIDPAEFIISYIEKFKTEVYGLINRLR